MGWGSWRPPWRSFLPDHSPEGTLTVLLLAPRLGRLGEQLLPFILIAVCPLGGHGQFHMLDPVGDPVASIGGQVERDANLGGGGGGADHRVGWWLTLEFYHGLGVWCDPPW